MNGNIQIYLLQPNKAVTDDHMQRLHSMLRHMQRRLATAEWLWVGALDKAGSNKSYLVRNYFYFGLFSAKPIQVIGMSYKQKWTRFTLALIVLLATASWGLVLGAIWLFNNITITWSG